MGTGYEHDGHWSAAQVSLFIGDAWIDDACEISWDADDRKEPIFGYNSIQYDGVAVGRSIIRGNLMIDFRFPGYLTALLAKQVSAEAVKNRFTESFRKSSLLANGLEAALSGLRVSDDASAVRRIADGVAEASVRSSGFGQHASDIVEGVTTRRLTDFHQLKQRLEDEFYPRRSSDARLPRPSSNARVHLGARLPEINILVVYGNDEGPRKHAELIQGARLVGTSKRIVSILPDGSQPIRERYPFLARDVVTEFDYGNDTEE